MNQINFRFLKRGLPHLSFMAVGYINAAISFSVILFLTRILSQEQFGQYSYGLVISMIVINLSSFGEDRTLVRDLIQASNQNAVLTASLVARLLVSGLCLFGVGSLLLSNGYGGIEDLIVFVFALSGAVMALTTKACFDVRYKMLQQVSLQLFERIFFIGLIACCYFYLGDIMAWTAALCLLLSRSTYILIEAIKNFSYYSLDFDGLWDRVRSVLSSNSFVVIAIFGNLLMTHVTQLLLKWESGRVELALYALAFQMVFVVRIFQMQVLRLLAPKIAEITREGADKLKAKRILRTVLLFSFVVGVFFALTAAVVFRYVFEYVFDESYLGSLQVFYVLLIWVCILGPGTLINNFLLAYRKEKTYSTITVMCGIFSIVCCYLLVGSFGAVGAAASLVLGYIVSVAFQFTQLTRDMQRPAVLV